MGSSGYSRSAEIQTVNLLAGAGGRDRSAMNFTKLSYLGSGVYGSITLLS